MSGLLEVEMNEDVCVPIGDVPVSIPERPRSTEKIHPSHGLGPDRPTAEQIKTAIDAGRTSPQTSPTTMYWVNDVERAFVALLWHHPQYIDPASCELDFELHISVPAHRLIIRAIAIVYSEIGDVDWTTVLQCIREIGVFDEVGGLEGLNTAYTGGGFCYEGYGPRAEVFYREYVRLIKGYAVPRQTDPFATVRRYVGNGFLRKNKLATKPAHPSVIGTLRCPDCGHNLRLRGWPDGSELKLKTELERS